MSKKVFKAMAECTACDCTGVYRGFAEKPNIGVVCKSCKGTGCAKIEISYTEFKKRRAKKGIVKVFQSNPGIGLSVDTVGGLPYKNWAAGEPFSKGTELRETVCPAWWFQGVDYKKKPEWDECIGIGSFSKCKYFSKKAACWARHDKEFK